MVRPDMPTSITAQTHQPFFDIQTSSFFGGREAEHGVKLKEEEKQS